MTTKKKPHLVLRACPFCGSRACIIPGRQGWYPSCDSGSNCPGVVQADDTWGGSPCDCKTEQAAADLWNDRFEPQ